MKVAVNEQMWLTEICPSDEAAFLEHLKAKEIYDQTLRLPYPYTAADFQKWLQLVEETRRQFGRPLSWAVRGVDDWVMGGIGFEIQSFQPHRAELGYWLAKAYWGRGLMTAVVRAACNFAFAQFNLTKISAHVFAPNAASARVLEKCGFVQEGFLSKHCLKEGRLIDARLYALFR